jgi:hypothetical protein
MFVLFLPKQGLPIGFCLLLCIRWSAASIGYAELEKIAEVTFLTIRDKFGLGFPAFVVGVLFVEATILTTVEIAPAMGALVFPKNLLTQDQLVLTMKTDVRHRLLL